MWVADIDIGAERILRNVPLKGGSDGTIRYAARGQTVALSRNSIGRWDVIGPGDKVIGITGVVDINIATGADNGTGVDFGFSFSKRSYDFYRGPQYPMTGSPNVQFIYAGGGNDKLIRSTGNWLSDSISATKWIWVEGSSLNDGAWGPIAAVSTTVNPNDTLEFAFDSFLNEGPVGGVDVGAGSLWSSALHGYPKVAILDAQGNEV